MLADHEMSPSAKVWLTYRAGALLEQVEDPASRLEVLEAGGVSAPTAVDALAALRNKGEVTLPVLAWNGEELDVMGEAVWEDGR